MYRALSLSLPLYSSLYPPSPSLSLSLLCRVISGNGAAAMFCLPGAGLLQAWRVPCLRSGFRDYPPPPLLPASLLFSSEATCNFSPNTYIQTPFRSCHGWGTQINCGREICLPILPASWNQYRKSVIFRQVIVQKLEHLLIIVLIVARQLFSQLRRSSKCFCSFFLFSPFSAYMMQ